MFTEIVTWSQLFQNLKLEKIRPIPWIFYSALYNVYVSISSHAPESAVLPFKRPLIFSALSCLSPNKPRPLKDARRLFWEIREIENEFRHFVIELLGEFECIIGFRPRTIGGFGLWKNWELKILWQFPFKLPSVTVREFFSILLQTDLSIAGAVNYKKIS
jgi:hypothetical protein